jgi:hypothetical protein
MSKLEFFTRLRINVRHRFSRFPYVLVQRSGVGDLVPEGTRLRIVDPNSGEIAGFNAQGKFLGVWPERPTGPGAELWIMGDELSEFLYRQICIDEGMEVRL